MYMSISEALGQRGVWTLRADGRRDGNTVCHLFRPLPAQAEAESVPADLCKWALISDNDDGVRELSDVDYARFTPTPCAVRVLVEE